MLNALLVIAVALILGLLSTRLMKIFGLPNVTGYLVVGLIIGPFALGQFIDGAEEVFDNLSIVSSVALGFIGFSIGVEFKLSHIKEIGKSAIVITICQALLATLFVDVTLVAVGSLFPNLGMAGYEAIILGAIATATAPAATLMVVRQYKAKGIVTGTLLPVVALDDAVGLVVFAISNNIALSWAAGVATSGAAAAISVLDVLVWPLVEILASLVVGAIIGALLSIIPRFFKSRDNRLIASLVAVFLSLGVCQLFEYLEESLGCPFKLSDLLVCMMAGATFVNLRNEARLMMEGVDRWTPVVLMLFFILSGAELNLRMFNNWGIIVCILLYIVARCCGKYFGTMLGATVTKSDPKVRKYLGITLFPQAGVAIGMASMCNKEFSSLANQFKDNAEIFNLFNDIGSKIVTITMCAVLIYELIGPVLTKWALMRAGEIDPINLGKSKKKVLAVAAVNGASDAELTKTDLQQDVASVESDAVVGDSLPDDGSANNEK